MRAAYRALPEELRKLETMRPANVRLAPKARSRHNGNNIAVMAEGRQVPNIHPLVRTISGEVQMVIQDPGSLVPHMKSGKLRGLGGYQPASLCAVSRFACRSGLGPARL